MDNLKQKEIQQDAVGNPDNEQMFRRKYDSLFKYCFSLGLLHHQVKGLQTEEAKLKYISYLEENLADILLLDVKPQLREPWHDADILRQAKVKINEFSETARNDSFVKIWLRKKTIVPDCIGLPKKVNYPLVVCHINDLYLGVQHLKSQVNQKVNDLNILKEAEIKAFILAAIRKLEQRVNSKEDLVEKLRVLYEAKSNSITLELEIGNKKLCKPYFDYILSEIFGYEKLLVLEMHDKGLTVHHPMFPVVSIDRGRPAKTKQLEPKYDFGHFEDGVFNWKSTSIQLALVIYQIREELGFAEKKPKQIVRSIESSKKLTVKNFTTLQKRLEDVFRNSYGTPPEKFVPEASQIILNLLKNA